MSDITKQREEAITKYSEAWLINDLTGTEKYFDENMKVKDPFAEDIQLDFNSLKETLASSSMKHIDLKLVNFVHQGAVTIFDWQLETIEDGKTKKYEGLSLFKFTPSNLIVEIREYATEIKEG